LKAIWLAGAPRRGLIPTRKGVSQAHRVQSHLRRCHRRRPTPSRAPMWWRPPNGRPQWIFCPRGWPARLAKGRSSAQRSIRRSSVCTTSKIGERSRQLAQSKGTPAGPQGPIAEFDRGHERYDPGSAPNQGSGCLGAGGGPRIKCPAQRVSVNDDVRGPPTGDHPSAIIAWKASHSSSLTSGIANSSSSSWDRNSQRRGSPTVKR